MNRLGWPDLTALGVFAILALNIGGNYGALPGILALGLLATVAVLLIDGHRHDADIARLEAQRDEARDDAATARMRQSLGAGEWR